MARFAGDIFTNKADEVAASPQNIAQLTPSMMDPLTMDDDELELRNMGVPQVRSLDYEKNIIKTPSAAGAQYYYDQARPGGRHL